MTIIKNFLNFFIYLLPISFIAGNTIINFNLTLISLLGIYIYHAQILKLLKSKKLVTLFLFFLTLIISTLLENSFHHSNSNIIKSFLFLRYLIFFLVIKIHLESLKFNWKFFTIFCFISTFLISLDVIFNFFLNDITYFHNSFLFGDEKIAGGYLQRFGVLSFFLLPIIYKNNSKKYLLSSFLFIIILGLAVLLSGNRTPFLMYLVSIFFIFIYHSKNYRKSIFIFLIINTILFLFISSNQTLSYRYQSFVHNLPNPKIIISELKKDYSELTIYKGKPFHKSPERTNEKYFNYAFNSGYLQYFITSLKLTKESPLIGRGIKSFRHSCSEIYYQPNTVCGPHAHNYYLEILNDTGFIGLLFFLIFVTTISVKIILKYRKMRENLKIIYSPILILLITELFPIRSTGSFFTTGNATFIFFLIAVACTFIELSKNKKKFNFY